MSGFKFLDFAADAFNQHKKLNIFIKISFYLIVIVANLLFLFFKSTYFYVFLWMFLLFFSPALLLVIKSRKFTKLLHSFIIFFVTFQTIGVNFCFSNVRDDICENTFSKYEVHSVTKYDNEGDEIEEEVFETGSNFYDFTLSLISRFSFFFILLIHLGGMPLHHIVQKKILKDNEQDP